MNAGVCWTGIYKHNVGACWTGIYKQKVGACWTGIYKQKVGACLLNVGTCVFETESECIQDFGNFRENMLCSNPGLNTGCSKQAAVSLYTPPRLLTRYNLVAFCLNVGALYVIFVALLILVKLLLRSIPIVRFQILDILTSTK